MTKNEPELALLEHFRLDSLHSLCRSLNVSTDGTKYDLIRELRAMGVSDPTHDERYGFSTASGKLKISDHAPRHAWSVCFKRWIDAVYDGDKAGKRVLVKRMIGETPCLYDVSAESYGSGVTPPNHRPVTLSFC
jgi:hypothetical protein